GGAWSGKRSVIRSITVKGRSRLASRSTPQATSEDAPIRSAHQPTIPRAEVGSYRRGDSHSDAPTAATRGARKMRARSAHDATLWSRQRSPWAVWEVRVVVATHPSYRHVRGPG